MNTNATDYIDIPTNLVGNKVDIVRALRAQGYSLDTADALSRGGSIPDHKTDACNRLRDLIASSNRV